MYKQAISTAEEKMDKTKEVFKRDMQSLRAGRANPQLLDRISVDYYGTMTPLNQMANISAPEPRVLVISPWDAKAIPLIEKALQMSDLGMNPANDGKIIRLIIPELNAERRKELSKKVGQAAEDSKVAIRSIRRDAMEQFKKMKKDSSLSEDDQRKAEEELQKVTDAATKEIDALAAEKEKEILAI
ncbi:MAG: ribosome recycling factor [Clostridiales bacterium]|nr:ribosome recycling factor [Clostridiales bacterium]